MPTAVDPITPPAGRRPEPGPPPALPYGPVTRRLLRPLQRGFLVLNRGFMAPLARRGLGWLVGSPLTGHVMVLRTRGRRSGLVREAPLGYVIRDGAVYCVAGYGTPTPWFRNLMADPAVEVILPTRRFRGVAAPVDPRDEWLSAYRALIASFGLVGRAVVGDIHRLDDAELLARHRVLPVVRIRPAEGEPPVTSGAFDPGGHGWLIPWAATIATLLVLGSRAGRRASAGGRACHDMASRRAVVIPGHDPLTFRKMDAMRRSRAQGSRESSRPVDGSGRGDSGTRKRRSPWADRAGPNVRAFQPRSRTLRTAAVAARR